MKKRFILPEVRVQFFETKENVMINIFTTISFNEGVKYISPTGLSDDYRVWKGEN